MDYKRLIARIQDKITSLSKANIFNYKHFKGYDFIADQLDISTLSPNTLLHKTIIWGKPKNNFIKVNIDGLVSTNRLGYGGILTNNNGNVLFAFSSPLHPRSII